MKHAVIFCLFVLMSVAIKAQDIDSSKRDISLIILDKKERPISNIIVQSDTKAGFTDNSGRFIFNNMSDNDTISMMLPKYGETFINVADLDSIVIKMPSTRRYYYVNGEKQNRYEKTTESTDILDVQSILLSSSYNSLLDLLRGVAGLNFTPSGSSGQVQTNIRGPASINGTNEPLIVLDGTKLGSFEEADRMINIREIKTIEVQKSASEWGMLGMNGAIVIKTK